MDKVIYVVGPTAVGKTELALRLAKKFNGELVNADSVQVYKGLDIISGKDISSDSQFKVLSKLSTSEYTVGYFTDNLVPIYLLDVVSPDQAFSVAQFQILGEKVISYIQSIGKTPIIVGGTGLYVKALTDGISTKDVPHNEYLRKKLENLSIEELQKMLSEKKLNSMNESDNKNTRRLIRAIEIEKFGQEDISVRRPQPTSTSIQIGLMLDRQKLKDKISKRVDLRMKNGALEEAEKLFLKYDSLTPQVKNTSGYKQIFSFLKKEITLEEAIKQWKISEYQLSKKQMTWFKKDKRINWFDSEGDDFEAKIDLKIHEFIL